MRIASVAYRVPSVKLTNQDVVQYIDDQNPDVPSTRKIPYLKLAKKLLDQTGAETRYWRDFDARERAADLIIGAMDDALDKANMVPGDIDLLIYCGVGRGFLEPANAYFYAKAKGMKTTNCFDVTDACMSWIRALHIAYLMLQAGSFKTVMIINGEFHWGFHDSFQIRDIRSLEYTFPTYTIGEAASATILVAGPQEWQFAYSSQPEYADLCTIPLQSYANFVDPTERMNLNGINRFVSYGRDLFREATKTLGELFLQTIEDVNSKVWYFPHAPSKTLYQERSPEFGLPSEKVYLQVYPRFGNLVSASIPVGLCLAAAEGRLKQGDPIALIPASAGLVAAVVQLTF
jgi:3-oxoacyl-[acyl-carrier-protein] synthase III